MERKTSPVPWAQIAAFVRQLSHDIRNDLNALSLESALLKELVTDPEAAVSATRIQTQLREVAARLKDLSARYALPAAQLSAVSLLELGVHLQNATPAKDIEWKVSSSATEVQTDPALLGRAFRELVLNATQYATSKEKPTAELSEEAGGGATLILREPGAPQYDWPSLPFSTLKAGRYGVGLYLAATILHDLGAEVTRQATDGGLETRIKLPAASPS